MVTLVAVARLAKGDSRMAEALEEAGWNLSRLATLEGAEAQVLDSVLAGIRERNPGEHFQWVALQDLVYASFKMAEVAWRAEGSTNGAELLEEGMRAREKMTLEERRKENAVQVMKMVPRKGKAKVIKWPTRLGKLMAVVGDHENLRQQAEETERSRWIEELKVIFREAGLPAADVEEWEGAEMQRVGKGRRASTLRKHVKTWQHARTWLAATFNTPWPTKASQLAMYLEARAQEPCGRSIPTSIYKTFVFLEHAGEVQKEQQLQNEGALKNALEEINMRLQSVEPKATKQAMHLPVKIVESWERVVMDESLPRYIRAFGWFKLAKVWGAMRHSDTTGVNFASGHLDSYCWSADLVKTKTTGPGKKVTVVKVFVSRSAFLVEKRWLETGWSLWQEMSWEASMENRDFFLTMPSNDLKNMTRKIASYAMATTMSHALANHMVGPSDHRGKTIHLLEMGAYCAWSEHSERVTMRTWARAAGIDEETCKRLGRWTPTVDQAYDRAVRMQILQAQTKVSHFITKNKGAKDPLDEELALRRMAESMLAMGIGEEKVEKQMERLCTFDDCGPPAKRVRWVEIKGRSLTEVLSDREGEETPVATVEDSPCSEEEGDDKKESRPDARLGQFVISTVGRSSRRTLHRVGECHRIPGVHFHNYELLGDEPPSSSEFHHACLICFPKGTLQDEREEEEISSSGDASSSDTESGGIEE